MSKPFRFKKFQIHHDRCAMKVGTDGVLLGAVAGTGSPNRILDIGTGTGLVALMLAQRFPTARIEAVEIDESAFLQAKENVEGSPWGERVHIWHSPFQDFAKAWEKTFDLIVSNPPYFPNHLLSIDQKRNLALHQKSLDFDALAEGVSKLLEKAGVFWVILPPRQMESLESELQKRGLSPFFLLEICDRPQKKIHRSIQGFSFLDRGFESRIISIKDTEGIYSKEYSDLLCDFLIIF
ncbi:Putative O-methyltransferase [Mariniradius saccharolyticus AK6]|uniref:tRNA1(Val) (adenine(37)-N6)-methyltransferase n=1 Tax=Mariniradius saccharolyticus AK6 TaxID=1239962 RepID=M7Y3K8_9BACT|nr:methyltransferase [Mariniradius saccharolyticus]EMS31811.1 Putative O-methyltransferase [Mariniradius saccharolyticus AK6]